MFKKLRNKLILINLGVTSFVIVVIFAMIYTVYTNTAENRPPQIQESSNEPLIALPFDDANANGIPDDFEDAVSLSVQKERESAARSLLITLIVSGISIELVVALVSYFMAEEAIKPVKEAYEAQKIFIANASHEIKTPLAAISANLEAADIKNNKWIANVETELDKLTELNNDLLNLARTELNSEITTEETDLKALTEKVLKSFEPRLSKKKLEKNLDLDKRIRINAKDYEQILTILMDNAIKYSDKSIVVKLTEHTLTVSNDGKRIPNEKLPHIFDRFYQVDKSSNGVGLGLSIAKSLAERNHWKLHVRSLRRTIFTLSF